MSLGSEIRTPITRKTECEPFYLGYQRYQSVSAFKWERCTPVFCDIDPETLNIDDNRIEEKITNKTSVIMPFHVLGSACDVETIHNMAYQHCLKVIYYAAHALSSKLKGISIKRI